MFKLAKKKERKREKKRKLNLLTERGDYSCLPQVLASHKLNEYNKTNKHHLF